MNFSEGIKIKNLVKLYGNLIALNNLSFEIYPYQFVTILGPNGAGKTTLIKIISNLVKPTSGKVSIFGIEQGLDDWVIRQNIGMISHQTYIYGDLSVEENLEFYGKMYNIRNLKGRICEILELLNLNFYKDRLAKTLSRGYQQRLGIARAIIHSPKLLILDEPFTGLDRKAVNILINFLLNLKKEKKTTILMTTHELNHSFCLSDTFLILKKGKIVFSEKKENLKIENFEDIYFYYTEGKNET